MRLLNRTTRKVGLTEIGREYYERCTQILAEVDEADRIASALQLDATRPAAGLLRHEYRTLHRAGRGALSGGFPEAAIDLRTGDRMPDLVEEGFDLAIRAMVPPDSSLIVRRLAEWRHTSVLHAALSRKPSGARASRRSRAHIIACAMRITHSAMNGASPTRDGKPAAVRVSGNLVTSSAEVFRTVLLSGGGLALAAPIYRGGGTQSRHIGLGLTRIPAS